jgi:predicted CoA-binding protein
MSEPNALNCEGVSPRLLAGDPAHDVFRGDKGSLDVFFRPKSVAVVGATEHAGTVGRTLLWNLITSSFGGTVYPVNPKRPSVLGIKAYPRISDIPEAVDLAVIATPAPTVPDIIAECVSLGVPGAIIISAGLKKTARKGWPLKSAFAKSPGAKCGFWAPTVWGSCARRRGSTPPLPRAIAAKGNVGFLSQSGAVHGGVGLEFQRENWVFGFRVLGVHVGHRVGRPDRLFGQRSQNRKHRDLHGIRGRCAFVHVGGPGSVFIQTHYRHQGGSNRRRRQSGGQPHGLVWWAATTFWTRRLNGAA